MEWLGVRLDRAANAENAATISAPDSKTPILVIPTNEERMIAGHTAAVAGLVAAAPAASRSAGAEKGM